MGTLNKEFPMKVELVADADVQIRHNAIEAARKTSNRLLETRLVKNFHLRIRMYPHHVLRENPLASGAGADRMSTGMKMSFGKPIGIAAQCKKGKALMEVNCMEKDLPTAVLAMRRAQHKIPIHCTVRVSKN